MRRSLTVPKILLLLLLVAFFLRLPAFYWGLPSATQTLATFHADEQISYYSIANWKPRQLKFPPGDALYWGELHLHTLAAALGVATIVGYIHPSGREALVQDLRQADRLYRVGRALSVVCGLLCVAVAFWAGRKLVGTPEGLMLAALTAWTPLQIIATFYVRPDCLLLLWGFVVMVLSADFLRNSKPRPLFWAAFICGLAAATKYTGGIFLVMPGMAWLCSKERRVSAAAKMAGGAALGFCLGCPVVLFNFPILANMLRHQFAGAAQVSTQGNPGTSWAVDYIRYFFPYALTTPVTICALGGFLWCLFKGERLERWLAASFILTYVVITAPKRQFVTYAVPLLPYLLFFAARSAGIAYRNFRASRPAALWLGFCGVAAVWSLLYSAAYMRLFWEKDARVEASEWLVQHVPQGTPIGIAKSFYWTPPVLRAYASPYRVIDPSAGDPPPEELARRLAATRASYFVLSDFEMRNAELTPVVANALREIVSVRSEEVAHFEHHAHLGPLNWPKGTPPWDWMVPYPTLRIYRMKA